MTFSVGHSVVGCCGFAIAVYLFLCFADVVVFIVGFSLS